MSKKINTEAKIVACTEKELVVLEAIRTCEFQDNGEDEACIDHEVWTDIVASDCSLKGKAFAGLCSSLQEKGLIYLGDTGDKMENISSKTIALTADGYASLMASKAKAAAPTTMDALASKYASKEVAADKPSKVKAVRTKLLAVDADSNNDAAGAEVITTLEDAAQVSELIVAEVTVIKPEVESAKAKARAKLAVVQDEVQTEPEAAPAEVIEVVAPSAKAAAQAKLAAPVKEKKAKAVKEPKAPRAIKIKAEKAPKVIQLDENGEAIVSAKRKSPAVIKIDGFDPRIPAVGTVLTRMYKGKDCIVEVAADGEGVKFVADGQEFKTISGAARHFNGAGNGQSFWGLLPKTEKKAA